MRRLSKKSEYALVYGNKYDILHLPTGKITTSLWNLMPSQYKRNTTLKYVEIEEGDDYNEESPNIFLAMNVISHHFRFPRPYFSYRRVVLKLNTQTLKASTPDQL